MLDEFIHLLQQYSMDCGEEREFIREGGVAIALVDRIKPSLQLLLEKGQSLLIHQTFQTKQRTSQIRDTTT